MTAHPIREDDLFELKFLNGAVISPDSGSVLYTVTHVEDEEEHSVIWWQSLTGDDKRQMTTNGKDPQWSPDGQAFAFVSDRNEKPQIFIMPVDGGEAQQLTHLKQGVGGDLAWSPDGKSIAFMAGPAVEEPFDFSQPYRITRHVYRFDDAGFLDQVVTDIYVVSIGSGDARQLTQDATMNTRPLWSPDSREILYLASMQPDTFEAIRAGLRVVDLDGKVRDLTSDWGFVAGAVWTPDCERIVFIGQPSGLLIGSKNDVYVIKRDGGVPENRTADLKYDVGGGLQADMPAAGVTRKFMPHCDNDSTWVRVQVGGTIQIYRVALNGDPEWQSIVDGERACYPLDTVGDCLIFGVSTLNDPMQLYVSDLNGGNQHQLTALNQSLLGERTLPEIEHLQFKGIDGVDVEGWYLKPPQGQAPYPTILYIHGGPHSGYGHVFSFDFQLLTGAGYGVVIVNHRASTGYGNDFGTAIKGDWGNLDYNDLMAGVDEAIARGLADADRLGVCGLSGGGNLSCWTVGQTDRFKAAVPENPVTNWVSFYGVSDIGVWFGVEQMGGHPHEIPEVYARCSPITYAHRCTTPTLLVVGEKDYRCPPEQAEQFYNVLKANGCTVEMLRMPDSTHAGTINGPVPSRRAHNEALLDWFQRYIPVT